MNEEFNNQNHDEENIEVEQDNELEHRHTEEPQKQSIIKSIWNHKIMMAIRRFWRKFHVTKLLLAMMLTVVTLFTGFLVYSAKTTDVSEMCIRDSSDFSLLRAKKAIQGILSESFEIQLTLSPIAAMGFYKTGAFMLAIADEREIIFLQETDLETKMIQNYILELIMMMGAVPLRFITSGPFAMRLSNMVDQLLKRLGTDIVILDELPTMNRYSSLAKMDLLLSQNDIDNLLF